MNSNQHLSAFQKVILFLFAAMAVIFAVWTAVSSGSWGQYVLSLFFSVLGALLTAFPDEFFYLKHFRYVEDPEPTEHYYFSHKVGCVILGFIVFVMYLKGVHSL